VDAHKSLHAAVDDTGREVGSRQGLNTASGWRSLAEWAVAQGESRQWGIEGAWGYGRGLAQQLVSDGGTVHEINAR
jgi:hypothetical protein